jgi:hypothetical protein
LRVEQRRPIGEAELLDVVLAAQVRPIGEVVSIASSSARASPAANTGVLPFLTECFGPRTTLAGFVGITWPTTSQSNKPRRAANRCLIDGADRRD